MADKSKSCTGSSSSSGTNSSNNCSVQELASLTDQCRASGRIRRESQGQAAKGSGQSLVQVLTRNLSFRLENLDLISIPTEQERSSVIIQTPKTSTPSNSPERSFQPLRSCQELAPKVPSRSHSHSPACSEVSSINTEVFRDTEGIDNSFPTVLIPLPRALQAPGAPIHHPVIHITGTMEAAEAELHQKNRKVYFKMRNYQLADLCEGSFDEHKQKIDILEGLLEDFVLSVEESMKERWVLIEVTSGKL